MARINREKIAVMNQHYKRYSLDYFLDAQERLDVRNIELWMSMPHFCLDACRYEDVRALRRKLAERRMRVIAVTSPSCDFQYQYAHPEKLHREKSIEYFKNGIRAAAELEARYMTVNSGWGYWNDDFEEAWKRSQDTVSALLETARREGVILTMESLLTEESYLLDNLEKTKRYFDEIDHPNFKIMIDTVAVMGAGETLEQWFETLGADIRHMHFVDGGNSYDHYAWGDGRYPLEQMLDCIEAWGYDGYLSQELTASEYLADPAAADLRNMTALKRFCM